MHFSFSAVNENADEIKLHFRPKTKEAENDQIAHRKQKRISVGLCSLMAWPEWPWPSDFTTYLRHWRYLISSNDMVICLKPLLTLLKMANQMGIWKPHQIYSMVPLSMTLSDLSPGF